MSTDTPGNEQHIKDQEADQARAALGELFGMGRSPNAEPGYEYTPVPVVAEMPHLPIDYLEQPMPSQATAELPDVTALGISQAILGVRSIGANLLTMRNGENTTRVSKPEGYRNVA